MRGLRLASCAAVAAASFALQAAGAAAAVDPVSFHPYDLRVYEGEETWHTSNAFSLSWTNPEDPSNRFVSPVAAVHYRVLDRLGAVVIGDTRIAGPRYWINPLTVPDIPDYYTAEVWLEDALGFQGAAASARLLFDDERPAPVAPTPPTGWIDRNAIPYPLHIDHPATTPISGIEGYAISVDSSPEGEPCAADDRCLDSEIDLRGGVDDDTLPLPELPEGTSYAHAVAVSGSGMRSSTTGTAVLRVDRTLPVTRLAGAPSGWSSQPVTLTATATDALSGMRASGPSGPFTAIRVDGGAPTTASGGAVSATVIGEGVHEVAYYARDAAGNVDDGGDSNGLPNEPPSTAAVRIDRESPSVSFVNSQDPREPELIEARVLDSLSGPDPSRGWIGVRRAGSGDRFEALPTEADGAGLRARWDSDSWPAGDYEFRASGYDAAGNATTTTRRASGAAMVLSNPLKTPVSLSRRGPAERLLPYGRGAPFSGRLVAGLSTPLAGMPVRIVERFEPGSSDSERVSTVWTDSEGNFAARLAPGPSREVTAAFAGTPTLSRAATHALRLRVRSGLRLRVSSAVARVGGRPLVFSGRARAAGCAIPPGGKAIQLQFRLPGLPWSEFRTVQTDARGRFRYAYRFSDDDSRGGRFQFRAFAPAQGGWPYEPGGSRPVAVRGR
ncbi:MAG TPA: hypothetical protein VFI63_00770 [Solirubrobacterales bacterium]|nr:hypothetical protein [Solirubrobacterales bacterium]